MSSVLITRRLPGASVARLAAHHDVDLHAGELPLSVEELHERLEGKAGVVVLLGGRIDRAAIDAAGPSLKIIANVAVGYDNLDVAYAASKGIVCTNTPDVLTDATADLTWALILGITRRLGEGERLLRAGAWKGWGFDFMLGGSLAGKLLGIVGGGRIGRAVATRAAAFGMRVAVSSRRDPQWPGVEFMAFDRLISSADVISLHVPLTPETRHLIDRKALTRMKRSAYFINTTRGQVVDEAALAWALERAPHRRRRARRLRARARGASRPARARERPAVAAPGQRHARDAEGHGRPGHRQRAGRAERPAGADADQVAMAKSRTGRSAIVNRQSSIVNRQAPVEPVMRGLSLAIDGMELPAIEKISESQAEDPFQVLIATLLSARTQDATTLAASTRLFRRARTPRTMAKLSVKEIERLIYPVSFYRNKARFVKGTCEALVRDHGGKVPTSLDEMVTLPGVGRKTANLVMILAYRSQREHLRGHARAPHRQPLWLGEDTAAGGDGAGAVRVHRRALVALHQPVPGDVGAERVPARVPALWRLHDLGGLS